MAGQREHTEQAEDVLEFCNVCGVKRKKASELERRKKESSEEEEVQGAPVGWKGWYLDFSITFALLATKSLKETRG